VFVAQGADQMSIGGLCKAVQLFKDDEEFHKFLMSTLEDNLLSINRKEHLTDQTFAEVLLLFCDGKNRYSEAAIDFLLS
jgi:hypothetical protein